jgi:hypothetical protein
MQAAAGPMRRSTRKRKERIEHTTCADCDMPLQVGDDVIECDSPGCGLKACHSVDYISMKRFNVLSVSPSTMPWSP